MERRHFLVATYGDYGLIRIGPAVTCEEGGKERGPESSSVAPEVEGVLMQGMRKLPEVR